MGTQKLFFMLVLALTSTLVACGNSDSGGGVADAGTSSSGSSTVTTPSASASTPFSLSLFTTYDTTSYNNALTFAETGTTTCTATTATPVVTCTATVPEGRLYYSSLSFAYSWYPSACKLLRFHPYGYMASTSSSYVAPGATSSVDCTASPIPLACYGGAAKTLVPGYVFGAIDSIIHLPDESTLTTPNSKTLVLPSAASALAGSNRQSVNDLDTAEYGTSFTAAQLGGAGDGYVANTYSNYVFQCRDDWYDPLTYTINLFIKDADSEGTPAEDDFYTWKEAP